MKKISITSFEQHGTKCLLTLALLLCLLPVGAMAIVYVDSPMAIEEAGEYQLVKDITGYDGVRWQNGTSFYEPCIKILASDVIFDGNGHTISGIMYPDRDDQVGIYVDAGLERVSVINTKVSGFNYGIYYYAVNQFSDPEMGGRIDNNNVNNNDYGVVLDASQRVSVLNNDASDTTYIGILASSSDWNVINSNIANNNGEEGIVLTGSRNNIVQRNSANNNINAGIFLSSSHNNTVQQNIANDNINSSTSGADALGDGIILDESAGNRILDNTASGNRISGITVYPVSEGEPNWVTNNSVFENGHLVGSDPWGWGIYVASDSEGTTHVNDNHAYDNFAIGIELHQNDGANSGGNLVEGNGVEGILLHGSRGNTLHDNIVRNNHQFGIEIATAITDEMQYISSDSNTLTDNEIYGHEVSGVFLNGSDNFEPLIENRLEGNDIYDNGEWGIHFYHANLNTLKENIIRGNGILGIKLDGSGYNVIYDNIFNNSVNAGFGQQSNNPNTWNVLQEPGPNVVGGPYKGGNYWAQPNGQGWSQINPDTKGNGFCDNAFVIGPGNVDNFPLINPLVVSFTGTPTSGDAPLTVNFAGVVTNQANVQWLWDFGDGGSSTSQNPIHVYSSDGVYSVSLTAYNAGWSNTTIKSEYISVGIAKPVADFTGTPVTGTFPLTVSFTDQSTPSTGSYAITGWEWDFGDGTPLSDVQNPVHVYQNSGTYTVTLTVNGPGGSDYKTRSSYITPEGTPKPTAAFTMDKSTGPEPLTVRFIDQSSGSPPLAYLWDFGDGVTSTDQNPEYTFDTAGTYTVSLTVTNAAGTSDPITHTIVVGTQEPPIAQFAAVPPSGTVPLTVSFVDQSTGNPVSWSWDFGDGATSTDRNPAHVYTTSGIKTVTLTVSNPGGSGSKSQYIAVNAPSPVSADFTFTASPSSYIEPVTVQFIDTSSGSPTSWDWDFGDGTSHSNLQSPLHVYSAAGNYTPMLTASNSLGQNTKIYGGKIWVRHTPPVAAFSASPTMGYAPFSVKFTDQSTGQALLNWDWNFGNGDTSHTQSPVYTFNTPGVYSVSMRSSNDGGWSSWATKPNLITVLESPPTPAPNIIKLYPGWNFVSTPKKLASGYDQVNVVFGGVDMDHHSPLLFNGQTKQWVQFISGTVKPLDGIWVYSKYQTNVTLQFDTASLPQPPSKSVYTGWNAVGESGVNAISARDDLISLGSNWNTLIGYNSTAQSFETAIIRGSTDPVFSDSRLLYPTHGYWLSMGTNDTLEGMA